jgi:hypothetical protein
VLHMDIVQKEQMKGDMYAAEQNISRGDGMGSIAEQHEKEDGRVWETILLDLIMEEME